MKTRHGFVSNSSSSSFIILLPDNFDLRQKEFTIDEDEYDGLTKDELFKVWDKILEDNGGWEETCQNESYRLLTDSLLSDYIISKVNSGPDESQLIIINGTQRTKVKDILSGACS